MMSVGPAGGWVAAEEVVESGLISGRNGRGAASRHLISVREENRAEREERNRKRQERFVHSFPSRGKQRQNNMEGKENADVTRQSFQAAPREIKKERRHRVNQIGGA